MMPIILPCSTTGTCRMRRSVITHMMWPPRRRRGHDRTAGHPVPHAHELERPARGGGRAQDIALGHDSNHLLVLHDDERPDIVPNEQIGHVAKVSRGHRCERVFLMSQDIANEHVSGLRLRGKGTSDRYLPLALLWRRRHKRTYERTLQRQTAILGRPAAASQTFFEPLFFSSPGGRARRAFLVKPHQRD